MSSRGAADGLRFTSCLGRSAATGFTSNRRPAVYHRPGSDRTDTPQLGLLLSDILVSQTERHFQPSGGPRRSGPLPSLTTPPRGSGSHQPRTPSRTGPSEDKSEYQSLFVPHRLTPSVGLDRGIVGKKGETGFTEGAELQLNTFQEKRIGSAEPRQTSSSVMRTDFPSPFPPQGTGAIPGLSALSCRETGFTRGASAPLSHPSSLLAPRRARSSAPAVKVIGKKVRLSLSLLSSRRDLLGSELLSGLTSPVLHPGAHRVRFERPEERPFPLGAVWLVTLYDALQEHVLPLRQPERAALRSRRRCRLEEDGRWLRSSRRCQAYIKGLNRLTSLM
ncbi:uncharacterized protein ppp1r32 isoform X2 [Kryptolebias marmoratus]|uniref:uncharacterized protein ppp1r32 isoform X2 n=1 Tax=Kryptolebias marmoratus TaxID=37003 RepID=UPI000D52FE57|nr:uncharacterized protein ppp1r32 isoform X2 [Kryptolebias marmoratus]